MAGGGRHVKGGAARRMTGGQAVAEALRIGGIELAFTVPGESFLGLLDALHDSPIRLVATRHEGAAAFAAEAYGQLTGRPAACLATRAVGAANLAIGLHTARQDSTPLVALVGQVPRAFRGREAFQEVDLVETFGRLCKAAVEVDEPERLASEVARLIGLARDGRPGPVLVSMPEDVLEEMVPAPSELPSTDPSMPQPDERTLAAVLDRLAGAERPLILCGGGVLRAGATARLVGFAEAWAVPVMAAWRRPDAFPNEHELYLGMTGYAAPSSVRRRLAAVDLVLALGCRLSEVATFGYELPGPGTDVVQVDLEPGLPGPGRHQPVIRVPADVAAFLDAALARLPVGRAVEAVAERAAANAADRAAYLAATEPPPSPNGSPVHPVSAVHALRRHLPTDAILTTDAGNFGGWPARYLRIPGGMRFLGPTSGAMGYALPAAMAAALAAPDRTVVALAGDGGFAMLMAELETCVRERLRLTAIVFDNREYGTIRAHQEDAHPGRVTATTLGPIDFAAVARACGATAWTIEHDSDVDGAVGEALAAPGVSVVHLRTDPRILSVDREL